MNDSTQAIIWQGLKYSIFSFAAHSHIAGWDKRDVGTIYVGFAYLNVSQQSEVASKLADPTRSVADYRLNPTYD